ncbi:uncharacterized protein G2W53_030080 [Senna tora]|uniref:Uncharacterized protein n=1 Tax=Senna tora TaxID=362788 RepID=A0A834WE95_9FABA|nr:uncharacterized protein G2W53_030080 [Senna tora]
MEKGLDIIQWDVSTRADKSFLLL